MNGYTAIDCQGFAGGFTLGMAQAGYELKGKREMQGGFGVPGVEANRRLLPGDWETQVGAYQSWDAPHVDVVFGNPPCSAFSMLGSRKLADDPVSSCMTAFVDFAARVNPRFAIFESVQQAYKDGLMLMRQLHARIEDATDEDWNLHHVLHNAGLAGGAADRFRYFWLVTREPFSPTVNYDAPRVTLRDAISDLEGLEMTNDAQAYVRRARNNWARDHRSLSGLVDGHMGAPECSDLRHVKKFFAALDELDMEWEQGKRMSHHYFDAWAAAGNRAEEMLADAAPPRFAAAARNGETLGGGYFETARWDYAKPARVVPGTATRRVAHPTEPRNLTLREVYRIQGFPDDWHIGELVKSYPNAAQMWPGKGIAVEAGEWIGRDIADCMNDESIVDMSGASQTGPREFVWRIDGRSRDAFKAVREALGTNVIRELEESLRQGNQIVVPSMDAAWAAADGVNGRLDTWEKEDELMAQVIV